MPDFELLSSLGINLDETAQERLRLYHQMLVDSSERMDLTKVKEEDMSLRHYADSLLVLGAGLIPNNIHLIDVGTGAGFPGLPLAIARPDIKVTLLESKQKRCAFLEEVVTALKLTNVRVLCARAEDLAFGANRELYDIATARAVASLSTLCEYLLPYVRVGGKALCWKGPAVLDELQSGQKAAKMLGGKLGELVDLGLPGRSSFVQVIKKFSATNKKYPRKAGTPTAKPLGVEEKPAD